MWDTIKFIIGLIIMAIIIVICCVVSSLIQPANPSEAAQGLPAVPVFVVVGLIALLIYELTSDK